MIYYIFHTALLLALGYLFYRFFLERETYFRLNRWVLLVGGMVAFSLPLLKIPEEWSLRKYDLGLTVFESQQEQTNKLEKPAESLVATNLSSEKES